MRIRRRSLPVIACAALFVAVSFSGCGDKSSPTGPTSGGSPVGTWNLTSATINGVAWPVGTTTTMTVVSTFASDNTYTSTTTSYQLDPANPLVSTEAGTWVTSGNKLITTPTGSTPDTVTYSVSGNSLSATEVDNSSSPAVTTVMVFTKQ